MSTVLYVLLAILMLGVMIAVHEFGHYATARLTGIPVREFAIGMGPKLLSRVSRKTGIRYSLRAVPLGGYCAFVGEDDPDAQAHEDKRAFSNQKLWKRLLTVLMGPVMNFILAFAVMLGWLWIGGVTEIRSFDIGIANLTEGAPAAAAGMMEGDIIVRVNGEDVAGYDDIRAVADGFRSGDAPVVFTVLRGEETVDLRIVPQYSEQEKRNLFGFTMQAVNIDSTVRTPGFWEGIRLGFDQCVYVGGTIFRALGDLFRGQGLDQVAGPIGTVSIMTEQVRQYGADAALNLLVVISVNLGIMNLLPIPGLDGSRILFMLVEAVRGKPIPPEKEAIAHLAGFVLLIGLMVFLSVRDIGNLFR